MRSDDVIKNKKEDEIPDWERNVVGVFVLPCRGKYEFEANDRYLKKVKYEADKKQKNTLSKIE